MEGRSQPWRRRTQGLTWGEGKRLGVEAEVSAGTVLALPFAWEGFCLKQEPCSSSIQQRAPPQSPGTAPVEPGALNPGAPRIHWAACGFGLERELWHLHYVDNYFTGWWNRYNRLIICNREFIPSLNLSVQGKPSWFTDFYKRRETAVNSGLEEREGGLWCKSFLQVFWNVEFSSTVALPLTSHVTSAKLFNLCEPLSSAYNTD